MHLTSDIQFLFLFFFVCVIDHGIGTLQPYWQPHNRAVARRIQNMGWRADGGLWLLVRGGGLYLSKGTGVSTAIRLSSLLSCLKISVFFSYLIKLVLRFIFVICHSLDQKQGKETLFFLMIWILFQCSNQLFIHCLDFGGVWWSSSTEPWLWYSRCWLSLRGTCWVYTIILQIFECRSDSYTFCCCVIAGRSMGSRR